MNMLTDQNPDFNINVRNMEEKVYAHYNIED